MQWAQNDVLGMNTMQLEAMIIKGVPIGNGGKKKISNEIESMNSRYYDECGK